MKTIKSLILSLVICLLFLANVKAQDEIDTLYLFPDTTSFIYDEIVIIDDISNFAIKLDVNDQWNEYAIVKLITMILDSSITFTSFVISIGEQPEDSIIYISEHINIQKLFPDWWDINISPPIIIKGGLDFYVSNGLLSQTAPSYEIVPPVRNEYFYREMTGEWLEGWSYYFAIKVVVSKITTGIDYPKNNQQNFYLKQNYPNPFNPSTKINYQIGKESFVQLKIYDVISNEVATLVNEYKLAGNYEVEFNASQLSSGIYFYKLQAGGFVETKKMILLR